MSYANIVKSVEEVIIQKETQQKPLKELDMFLQELNQSKSKQIKVKNVELTTSQSEFLDYCSATIFDLYYDLREEYSDFGLFHRIDYNGFQDIFLNNIRIEELYDSSDDEHVNENDDHLS